MPKRKLVKTSEETIALIKQAHEREKPISEEESLKIRSSAYRPPMPKELPFGTTVIGKVKKGKNGELRIWPPDAPKGPGHLEMPLTRALQEYERDTLADITKRIRRPPTAAAAKAKVARSKRGVIEQAWREYGLETSGAAKRIAKALNASAGYVRKVRAKMRQSEGIK